MWLLEGVSRGHRTIMTVVEKIRGPDRVTQWKGENGEKIFRAE